jgi:hypothetical protein
METSAMAPLTRIGCGLALAGALVLVPVLAIATPGADGYIEGYATAVLEREFRVTAPSLRVQNGVIAVSAADFAAPDRERIVAAMVARIEAAEGSPRAASPELPPAATAGRSVRRPSWPENRRGT